MMNYEHANALKDAGWKQHRCKDATCSRSHPDRPTLSELIKACVEKKRKLGGFLMGGHGQGDWNATAYGKIGEGATPEEAVARLWLALNKPS